MKFCEFCVPFYTGAKSSSGIRGTSSQGSIAEFFMSTALGEMAKIELAFTDDTFRKWFKGERDPKPELWGKVADAFDETRFSRTVSAKLNEKTLPTLLPAFGINLGPDSVPDKFTFSAALAKQFGAIARGNGEADDIVSDIYQRYLNVSEFPDYITNSQAKYGKLKTLLYTSEERQFDDFFVCNTISRIRVRFHRLPDGAGIENATNEDLLKVSKCTLLVGMGGIGKSMMMRHLFLSSIRKYSQTGLLPILVILREFGADNSDLFNMIVDSVHRFDITFSAAHIHKLLAEGKCQLLLDGLDEIKMADMASFQRQLDAIIDRYPKNQYVMSTRRFSTFVELSRFTVLFILPFSNEQALELIDRLEYCPEEPKLKQQFRDKLISDYFRTHAEFVTNPLLLTLMLMSYHRFADVPEKKYLFYEQAYQTLLQRHDSDKLAYKRVFQSVTDPADFTWVFREFCAKSYRKGDYEFSRKKFEEYFGKIKAISRMDPELMKVDNFLFDVCHSACLMYEEGQTYHFLHRSFQEYFFADYYSRQDDTTLRKLGKFIEQADQLVFDESSAFEMLYDLAPDKVERFIIMPFLEEVFDTVAEDKQYWNFLKYGYTSWIYTVLNDSVIDGIREEYGIRERYPVHFYDNGPASTILSLVIKILKIDPNIKIGRVGEDFKYEEFICERLYGEILHHHRRDEEDVIVMPIMRVPEELLADPKKFKEAQLDERLVLDAEGKPVEFGGIYEFEFKTALEEPEKYGNIRELWEKDGCPARQTFSSVKSYYETLKTKYAHADELDDDDF